MFTHTSSQRQLRPRRRVISTTIQYMVQREWRRTLLMVLCMLILTPTGGLCGITELMPAGTPKFTKLAGQAVSSPTIAGLFRGDAEKNFDVHSMYVCLPQQKDIKPNWRIWLRLSTRDGLFEATYQYDIGDNAGKLIKLVTRIGRTSPEELGKYESWQVAQNAYLGPSEIEPASRLVIQSSETAKGAVYLQINTTMREARVVDDTMMQIGGCDALPGERRGSTTTLRFNRICSFDLPKKDRVQLQLRPEGYATQRVQLLKEDIVISICR